MIKKLTIKQQRFVKEIVKSGNGTQAALKAYNIKSDIHTAESMASENMRKPEIVQAINEVFKKEDMNVEWVLKGQKKLAEGNKVENNVKAKVFKDVGEFLGMYKDKGNTPVTVINGEPTTLEELEQAISRIKSIRGEAKPLLHGESGSELQPSKPKSPRPSL